MGQRTWSRCSCRRSVTLGADAPAGLVQFGTDLGEQELSVCLGVLGAEHRCRRHRGVLALTRELRFDWPGCAFAATVSRKIAPLERRAAASRGPAGGAGYGAVQVRWWCRPVDVDSGLPRSVGEVDGPVQAARRPDRLFLTAVITSPRRIPAWAAELPAVTAATVTPAAGLRPYPVGWPRPHWR